MTNKQYIRFNGLIYPTAWFTNVIKLKDLEYDNFNELYNWALECKIPFILDEDEKEIYLMDTDAMAFKLQWL